MVNVAVLGGATGHVGRTLVDVLKQDNEHAAFVISRNAPRSPKPGVQYIQCAYDDVDTLAAALEANNIHTVISCLLIMGEPAYAAQKLAIDAADKSTVTERFIASNWANPSDGPGGGPWAKAQIRAREDLAKTSLIWTELATGYFMDFWGMPHIKTHLLPMMPVIDIKACVAAIPGTGEQHVPFTYSYDVARFVVEKVLSLPADEWKPVTTVFGERLTWNEFLALAEDARGVKFEVSHDSEEDLAAGRITELPNHVDVYPYFPKPALSGLYAGLELLMAKGQFDIPTEKALNHQKFPDFKMMTVAEMLAQTWKVAEKPSVARVSQV